MSGNRGQAVLLNIEVARAPAQADSMRSVDDAW